jgi:hypothetical protein
VLDEDGMLLGDGGVLAMAVKELPPLVWRTFAEGHVALSEEGAVAARVTAHKHLVATTGVELTEGKHYWEVELLSENRGEIVDIGCYLYFDLLYSLVLDVCIGSQQAQPRSHRAVLIWKLHGLERTPLIPKKRIVE